MRSSNHSTTQTRPSKTLFILAGCSGSGKSTLLQAFSEKNIKLFFKAGREPQEKFPTSKLSKFFSKPENSIDNWTSNLNDPSNNIFSTHQITKLKEYKNLGNETILHVDLRDLAKSHFNISDAQIAPPDNIQSYCPPRGDLELTSKSANKIAINLLLNDSFFGNFSEIYVSTIFLEWEENQKRFEERCVSQNKSRESLFELSPELSKQAHTSIYHSWLEEITSFHPTGNTVIIEKNGFYLFRSYTPKDDTLSQAINSRRTN